MAGTSSSAAQAFIMRVLELAGEATKVQCGTVKPTVEAVMENSEELKEFGGAVVQLMGVIMQHYEAMRDAGSEWAELYIRVVTDVEKIIERMSIIDQDSLPGLSKMKAAVDLIKEESMKFANANPLTRFASGVRNKEAIVEAKEKLLDAQLDLSTFFLMDLHKKPALSPEKMAEFGGLPDVPEWYIPRPKLEGDIVKSLKRGLHCAVVEGKGGMGKSTMAANLVKPGGYLSKYFDGGAYWIHVGQRGKSDKDIANLMKELHNMMVKALGSGRDVLSGRHVRLECAQDNYTTHIASLIGGRKCLVVLDNVVSHHQEFVVPLRMRGISLLVTTTSKCEIAGRSLDKWLITDLTPEESLKLMSNHVGKDIGQVGGMNMILGQCNGHPLTLTVCATFLKNKIDSKKMDMEEAVMEVESALEGKWARIQMRTDFEISLSEGDHERHSKLGRFIDLALDLLSHEEVKYYLMLAVLPFGSYVSKEMLQGIWECDKVVCDKNVLMLSSLFLIHPRHGGDGEVKWGLHDLQMEYVRKEVDEGDLEVAKERQIAQLSDMVTFWKFIVEDEYELLRFWVQVGGPNAFDSFLDRNKQILKQYHVLAALVAEFLLTLGCPAKAVEVCKPFQDSIAEDVGDFYPGVNVLLGCALLDDEKPQEGEKAFNDALSLLRNHPGDNRRDIADCLNNLGLALHSQAKYDEAENMYGEALALYKALYRKDAIYVASVWNNMACVSFKRCNYRHAEDLWRKALCAKKNKLGGEHPKILEIKHNLALALYLQGSQDEAHGMFKEVVLSLKKLYGERHPKVANSMEWLANVFVEQGEYERAQEMHEEVLSVRIEAFGNEHFDVARSHANLACVSYKQKKFYKCNQHLKNAFGIFLQLGGHPCLLPFVWILYLVLSGLGGCFNWRLNGRCMDVCFIALFILGVVLSLLWLRY